MIDFRILYSPVTTGWSLPFSLYLDLLGGAKVAGQSHLSLFLLKMKDFTPPLTPPQGGELEKSSDFERIAFKIAAKNFKK
ncbi:MAG: hypothetical protein GYA59_03980 [Chloroflexi bacterium]|nr:hypothetical protein [Chloroflexota bacterium]